MYHPILKLKFKPISMPISYVINKILQIPACLSIAVVQITDCLLLYLKNMRYLVLLVHRMNDIEIVEHADVTSTKKTNTPNLMNM